MSAQPLSNSNHFHIRWGNGALDYEDFVSRKEADEAARRWVRRGEAYSIEEFNDSCEQCAETRRRLG